MTHNTGCFYDVAEVRILKKKTGFKLRSKRISQSVLRTGEVSPSFASNILHPRHQQIDFNIQHSITSSDHICVESSKIED